MKYVIFYRKNHEQQAMFIKRLLGCINEKTIVQADEGIEEIIELVEINQNNNYRTYSNQEIVAMLHDVYVDLVPPIQEIENLLLVRHSHCPVVRKRW